jgi:hypothetical protein
MSLRVASPCLVSVAVAARLHVELERGAEVSRSDVAMPPRRVVAAILERLG